MVQCVLGRRLRREIAEGDVRSMSRKSLSGKELGSGGAIGKMASSPASDGGRRSEATPPRLTQGPVWGMRRILGRQIRRENRGARLQGNDHKSCSERGFGARRRLPRFFFSRRRRREKKRGDEAEARVGPFWMVWCVSWSPNIHARPYAAGSRNYLTDQLFAV